MTVFVALREKRKVTMRVYTSADAGGKGQGKVAEGTRSTVPLGKNLHVVAVTAKPPAGQELKWGTLYVYNLFFGTHGNDATSVAVNGADLFSPGLLVADGAGESAARELLLYRSQGAPTLPSFPLPPVKLNELRIVHGSCRKAHGPMTDRLPLLDDWIRTAVTKPVERPHQLFLGGDQIYADDVADPLLAELTDAGNTLLGRVDKVPIPAKPPLRPSASPRVGSIADAGVPWELRPGRRQGLVSEEAALLSGHAKSHLLTLGEYCAQYLFAWSDVLWPSTFVEFTDIHPMPRSLEDIRLGAISDLLTHFDEERANLTGFRNTLRAVRRALAHVPTYMTFDDHEVTDDWFIDLAWCSEVLRKPLGRYVVENGLLAYAIFQAWGNTPERFLSDTAGGNLLAVAGQLDDNPAGTARAKLKDYLGPPDAATVESQKRLSHPTGGLDWHYIVRGPKHEVIVLDSRTLRAYPNGPKGSPALISEQSLPQQVPLHGSGIADPPPADGVTFIVAAAPVLGVELIEWGQEAARNIPAWRPAEAWLIEKLTRIPLYRNGVAVVDAEAWGFSPPTFELLIAQALRRNRYVVILSGDVHYGFSIRLEYRATTPYRAVQPVSRTGVIAQLTSSALRNEVGNELNAAGYAFIGSGLARQDWAGWNAPPTIYWLLGSRTPTGTGPWVLDARKKPKVSRKEDWRYQIDFVAAKPDATTEFEPIPPPAGTPEALLNGYLEVGEKVEEYLKRHGPGKELVGKNNIGEVCLKSEQGSLLLTHRLWWRADGEAEFRSSEYEISLEPGPELDKLPLGP